MSKIKRPSISEQKKIDEVMELMNKYGIRITRAEGTDDADFVLYMNDDCYAVTNTDYFPPVYDIGVGFIKSNPYGHIYTYDDEGNVIE